MLDAAAVPDRGTDSGVYDAGTADATGPDGGDSLCEAVCTNAWCGTPFGGEGECLERCRAATTDCDDAERARLRECAGDCDRLYPCIADVGCVTDEPTDAGTGDAAIACGAEGCADGETCFSCAGIDGEDPGFEPTCVEDTAGGLPPHHDGGACGFHMLFECDGPEDCAGSCVYGEYDTGMTRCDSEAPGGCAPTDPDPFTIRGVTVCHELSDCPPCATQCKPLTSYDWLTGVGVSIGVCAS